MDLHEHIVTIFNRAYNIDGVIYATIETVSSSRQYRECQLMDVLADALLIQDDSGAIIAIPLANITHIEFRTDTPPQKIPGDTDD